MRKDRNNIYILCISVMFVIVSLLCMGIYQYVNIRNAEKQIYSTLNDSINEQKNLIETKIQGQYTTLEAFANSLASTEIHTMDEIVQRMDAIVKTKSTEFKYLAIGGKDGILYTSDGRTVSAANRDYYEKALNGENGIEKIDVGRLDPDPGLFISVPVIKNGDVLGVVVGCYDISTFEHLLNPTTFKNQGYSYLIDKRGNIVLDNNNINSFLDADSLLELLNDSDIPVRESEQIQQNFYELKSGVLHYSINSKARYAVYQPFGTKDWMLVHVVSADVLKTQTQPILLSGWILIIFMTVFAVLTVILISHNARKNIKQKEKQKVALMVSQIKPHFLYNTLTAIQEMCYSEPRQAAKAIVKFSNYLRTNIDFINSEELIPFSLEKSHINNYIDIEIMRFGEDLCFEEDIQTADFLIPPLTLQPLVENAVKHGVCKRVDKGTIKLSTRRLNNRILITISDDGVGFHKGQVQCRAIESVETRIKKIMHGKMTIESKVNVGTTITINIPFKEALHENCNH